LELSVNTVPFPAGQAGAGAADTVDDVADTVEVSPPRDVTDATLDAFPPFELIVVVPPVLVLACEVVVAGVGREVVVVASF